MHRILCLASFLLFVSTSLSLACSCAAGDGPPCEEAWSKYTSAVFLGKVTGIKVIRAVPGDAGPALSMSMGGEVNSVEFAIEEPYFGVSGSSVKVRTNSSEASCGYEFVEGEQYVVYASKDSSGGLFVSLCSRTRPAKYAEEDISYFRSLPTLPTTATILGSVWRYTHDPKFQPKFQPSIMDHYRPPEQEYVAMEPVAGMKVAAKAKDGTEHATSVNSAGEWKISGLVPGQYLVDIGAGEGTYVHPFRAKVEVVARGCAQVDIRVESNGRLIGQLNYSKPDSDWALLTAFALPIDKPDLRHPTTESYIDLQEHAFDLGPLPPGKYVLGVYLIKKIPTEGDGFRLRDMAPTYYPGVTDIHSATPIEVKEGQSVRDLRFTMLKTEFLPEMWRCEICNDDKKSQ